MIKEEKAIELLKKNKKKVIEYYNKEPSQINSNPCSKCIIKKLVKCSCSGIRGGIGSPFGEITCYSTIRALVDKISVNTELDME